MAFRALTRFAAPATSLASRALTPAIVSSAARSVRAFSPAISSITSANTSSIRAFSTGSFDDEYGGGFVSARVTRPAPTFTADAVVNGEFKTINLSDYQGKYVVLLFYPLDFTFVCPTELISFSEKYPEFQKNNCEVLGISVDSKFTHLAWTQTPRSKGGIGNLNFPLVSDLTKSISTDYDVLLDKGIALRGLFIIDDKGVLRSKIVNDLPVGRSVDETLRLVQAFQYTDKSGDVIPCDWKPGKDTMKGDPKGAQSYFKKVKDN